MQIYGANIDNLFGIFTSHFFHLNIAHLVNNILTGLILLSVALCLEKQNEKIRKMNLLWWIIVPVLCLNAFLVFIFAYILSINPYQAGLSLCENYFNGLFLYFALVLFPVRELGKKLISLKLEMKEIFPLILFLLFFRFSMTNGWSILAAVLLGSSEAKFQGIVHGVGLVFGMAVGWVWKRNLNASN